MELALSLGDAATPFTFLDKTPKIANKDLGFCMALGNGFSEKRSDEKKDSRNGEDFKGTPFADPPVQLDLLPSVPVPRTHTSSQFGFPWLADNMVVSEPGSSEGPGKGLDVNRLPMIGTTEEAEDGAALSSPNSTVSSFHMDFGVRRSKRDMEAIETERTSERASDDEENGSTRKKLRLSKGQSAFLEESFKEHSTLNPKQKDALAKQLNLRPRQVEVWFQNRRARTKLKQTEVDCEYLKRCCETLTEENRRLQKELLELRALKTSQPFYMQLPATTLTMCPSCERVATATTTNTTVASTSSAITTTANPSAMSATTTTSTALSLSKPRITVQQQHHPFSHIHANKAAAS